MFALKNILVLLAKHNSGELCCPATALICMIGNFGEFKRISKLLSTSQKNNVFIGV